MNRHTTLQSLRTIDPRSPLPESQSPSAELEGDALREFGDRDGTAIQAIFHARRHMREVTFFVEPEIAAAHGLSRRAMEEAMDRLKDRLIETGYKKRGKPRWIRLLPDWENLEALAGDLRWYYQKNFTETVIANGGGRLGIEEMRSRYPNVMLSPEVLAALQRRLDLPPKP